jgi:hypothetical protein
MTNGLGPTARLSRRAGLGKRVLIGVCLLGAAGLWRLAVPSGKMLVDCGCLPSVHEGDIVTIPLGLAGLALLASAPRLPVWRRVAGAGLMLAAILWPVSTSDKAGPVVVALGSHGIHRYDALSIVPATAAAALLGFRCLVRRPRDETRSGSSVVSHS